MADDEQPKSITEYDGTNYKKQYVSENGDVKTVEYKKKPGTKSINEQLTENMDETIARWKKESVEVITGDWEENLKKYKGYYCRYQTTLKHGDNKGELCVRNGGFIAKVTSSYVYLTSISGGWSVQYDDVKQIFIKKKKKRGKQKKPKVPKKLKKAQQEVQDEIEAKEEEEAEAEAERQEKEKKKKKKPKPVPKPAKLTDEEAEELLQTAYYDNDMKFGRDKLFHTLKEDGHRITRKQVDEWLKKQVLYQIDKPAFKPKTFVIQTAKKPNSVWNIDLVEMDGDKVVLNAVDRFSKFAYSRILRNKTAKQVVNALKSLFRTVKPDGIVSDNGPEFKSKETQDFLKSQEVTQVFSSEHSPQSNGLVEHFNKEMKSIFKKMTYQKTENKTTFTQPILNRILKAYNNSYHSVIEMKPSDALKEENREEVLKANEKQISVGMKQLQDAKNDISKGDQVRISLNKFNDKKTKQYRTNWSEEVFFVAKVLRGKNMKPIQYKIEDGEGTKLKGLYKREEVQPIKYTENEDKVSIPYEIERFIKEEGDEILVSFKGYKADGNRYLEKSVLKADLGNNEYKKLYDEMKN